MSPIEAKVSTTKSEGNACHSCHVGVQVSVVGKLALLANEMQLVFLYRPHLNRRYFKYKEVCHSAVVFLYILLGEEVYVFYKSSFHVGVNLKKYEYKAGMETPEDYPCYKKMTAKKGKKLP